MNLSVFMGVHGHAPPNKNGFEDQFCVFWGVFYNNFSQLFYQSFIRLALFFQRLTLTFRIKESDS